jgi:ClpP class serine protease
MVLGFLNEILRGVWLLDSTVQDQYAKLALAHLESLSANREAMTEVNQSTIVAVSAQSGRQFSMSDEVPADPYVSVVSIQGVVKKNSYCGDMGTMAMQSLMKQAESDPNCMGHILAIDSPGGSASNTQTFANFIKNECQKPVVASISGMCASAAYYIACAADEIYCAQGDDSVGSIGVYCTLNDYRGAYKKEGIVQHTVYATASSEKNQLFQKALDGDYTELQKEYLDPCAEEFISTVKAFRPNLTEASAYKGKLYAAKNSPKGMIDGQKTWEQAVLRVSQLATAQKAA